MKKKKGGKRTSRFRVYKSCEGCKMWPLRWRGMLGVVWGEGGLQSGS